MATFEEIRKVDLSQIENKVLAFGMKKIFKKSIMQRAGCDVFNFYEGHPLLTETGNSSRFGKDNKRCFLPISGA